MDRRQEVAEEAQACREQQAAEDEEADAGEPAALGELAETRNEDGEDDCFHDGSPDKPRHAGCRVDAQERGLGRCKDVRNGRQRKEEGIRNLRLESGVSGSELAGFQFRDQCCDVYAVDGPGFGHAQ